MPALSDHYPFPDKLPRRFGPYTLDALIGSGGMGHVFRARRESGGVAFVTALKVVRYDRLLEPGAADESAREAQALASVKDDHVVRVNDVGLIAGVPYLDMELLEGVPLTRLVGKLTLGEALQVLLDAARGLAALHARGLIHRDVKPANVFVTQEGRAKLMDLGIAKGLDGSTSTSVVKGTPRYLAPEQRVAAASVRSDVFSWAAVAWEVFSGTALFDGRTESEVDTQRFAVDDRVRDLAIARMRADDVPESEGFFPLIASCLSYDERKRPAGGQALVDALEAMVPPKARRAVRAKVAGETGKPAITDGGTPSPSPGAAPGAVAVAVAQQPVPGTRRMGAEGEGAAAPVERTRGLASGRAASAAGVPGLRGALVTVAVLGGVGLLQGLSALFVALTAKELEYSGATDPLVPIGIGAGLGMLSGVAAAAGLAVTLIRTGRALAAAWWAASVAQRLRGLVAAVVPLVGMLAAIADVLFMTAILGKVLLEFPYGQRTGAAQAVQPSTVGANKLCGRFVTMGVRPPAGFTVMACGDSGGSASLIFTGSGTPSAPCSSLKNWAEGAGWIKTMNADVGGTVSYLLRKDGSQLVLECTNTTGATTATLSIGAHDPAPARTNAPVLVAEPWASLDLPIGAGDVAINREDTLLVLYDSYEGGGSQQLVADWGSAMRVNGFAVSERVNTGDLLLTAVVYQKASSVLGLAAGVSDGRLFAYMEDLSDPDADSVVRRGGRPGTQTKSARGRPK